MPAPADFASWDRAQQIDYLTRTYGTVEDRQRAAGGNNALASARFRANNVATADYVSPEERALWAQVKPDEGTWAGNFLSNAAGPALGIGLALAGGLPNALGGGAGAGAGGGVAGGIGSLGAGMGWDWGRVLDYAAPIVGGLLEGQGAKDAGRAAAASSQAAIAETRRQYDQSRADMMPWLEAGRGALGQLQNPTANFMASPDYEFRRGEGMRGIENSFAARGGAASGNALRALNDFNSNLASGEYGSWWNRQAGLAGVGQTSAQNLGSFGANAAGNIGNALQNAGAARASGIEGQTNALSGMLQGLWSTYRNRNPKNTMSL